MSHRTVSSDGEHWGKELGADERGRVMAHSKTRVKRIKKEGHDELIAKLTPPGTTIRLMMMSGLIMIGELGGSDRFTISLKEAIVLDTDDEGNTVGQKLTNEKSPVQIVYKHGIESFNLHVHGDKNKTHGPDDAPDGVEEPNSWE